MYRDLVHAPEKINVNGRLFWTQEFYQLCGSLEAVRLYTEDGEFIADFTEWQDALRVMKQLAGERENAPSHEPTKA